MLDGRLSHLVKMVRGKSILGREEDINKEEVLVTWRDMGL